MLVSGMIVSAGGGEFSMFPKPALTTFLGMVMPIPSCTSPFYRSSVNQAGGDKAFFSLTWGFSQIGDLLSANLGVDWDDRVYQIAAFSSLLLHQSSPIIVLMPVLTWACHRFLPLATTGRGQ